MQKQISVTVRPKHIKKGRPMSAAYCPIACALRDKGLKGINVGHYGITIGREGHGGRFYDLPLVAQDFVHDFDNYRTVQPFKFVATLEQ